MIYPDDIVFNDKLTPSEASEYIIWLERSYTLKGERQCEEIVYLAALKAISVVKNSNTDSYTIDAANSFLLNTAVKTPWDADLKDPNIQSMLEERDRVVKMEPAANRPTVFHLSIPFQNQENPRGLEIGLFTSFEKAELALHNLVKAPINIFQSNNDGMFNYVIAQEVTDYYNHRPGEAFISVWCYDIKGKLIDEWFNNLYYNINGTIKCDWEMEVFIKNTYGYSIK